MKTYVVVLIALFALVHCVDGSDLRTKQITVKTLGGRPKSKIEIQDTPVNQQLAIRCCLENGQKLMHATKNYGCQIITMPPSIIKKISMFGKTHRELTLDTVKKFLKDSKESNFKI